MKMLHMLLIKEINDYRIFQVTRDDYFPENLGRIHLITPDNKEYPVLSIKEAEKFIEMRL